MFGEYRQKKKKKRRREKCFQLEFFTPVTEAATNHFASLRESVLTPQMLRGL